jgi:hypothetical protein
MDWKPVKKLKADKVHFTEWHGSDNPWEAVEAYMKDGYLPPIVLCRLLVDSAPAKITRNRMWVLAGAIQSVKCLEGDTGLLRKALRALARG